MILTALFVCATAMGTDAHRIDTPVARPHVAAPPGTITPAQAAAQDDRAQRTDRRASPRGRVAAPPGVIQPAERVETRDAYPG